MIIVCLDIRLTIVVFLIILIGQTEQFAFRVQSPIAINGQTLGDGVIVWTLFGF